MSVSQDRRIAEAMGWRQELDGGYLYAKNGESLRLFIGPENITPRCPHRRFSPFTSIADAMEAVGWLCARGWDVHIGTANGPAWCCEVSEVGRLHLGASDSLPEAITSAIEKAIETVKGTQ